MNLSGIYSHNRYFDTFYMTGAQELPELEKEVYVEDSTTSTIFESYEDYLTDAADGWPEFIRDFCE